MTKIILPKELKNAVKLEIEQCIYIPSTKNDDKSIDANEFKRRIKEVEKYLAKLFGGETTVNALGGYYGVRKNKLISEKIAKIYAYSTKSDFNKNKNKLMSRIKVWKKQWGQEKIGYELEGDLFYI